MAKRAANQPIRVLLVEDSWSQREMIAGLLRAAGFQLAGTAANGREAVEAARQLRPDVIAMDIHLPGLDGYEATRQIMQICPMPIVLVSGNSGDAGARSLEALAAGALAVVQKPGAVTHPDHLRDRDALLKTLRLMADVPVVTRFPARGYEQPQRPLPAPQVSSMVGGHQALAIAASTGGPAAVQMVLRGLGPAFPLPVLLAQHIAESFVGPLADWLGSTQPLAPRIASSGDRLLPGTLYLAPERHHLMATPGGRVELRPQLPEDRYCPSADVLFESVARAFGARAIGIILTGMGDDGAHGLRRLRAAGAHTIGQSSASCVVYGMPQAAAHAGALAQTEDLEQIAPAILRLLSRDSVPGGTG